MTFPVASEVSGGKGLDSRIAGIVKRIRLDTKQISDWDSFHEQFRERLGFPEFYGKNMDAWIDCMSCLDDADAGMSSVTLESGEQLVIELPDVEDFRSRCPEQLEALVDCTAAVNRRFLEGGDRPVLLLAFT